LSDIYEDFTTKMFVVSTKFGGGRLPGVFDTNGPSGVFSSSRLGHTLVIMAYYRYVHAIGALFAVTALMPASPPAETAQRLINLNVTAVDSHGNPVEDLSAGDFQVFDSGKPQQIASFRHTDSRAARPEPLGPHEFSNRSGADTGHATVILFDLLNEHLEARGPAWNELIHTLQPLESSQGLYFYILTMDGRVYPVRGLPDPEKDPEAAETTPWTRQIKPILDEAMKTVTIVRPTEIWIDERVRLTYNALSSLAARMAGMPGRKNIVWITHGVPIDLSPTVTGMDWIDYRPLLRQLSERLDRSNVSIYPVQQIPPGMAMMGPDTQHSGISSEDTLQEFARYTGGRANGTNDIREAIHQAMNDVRTGYQVGYYPVPQNWDGKFHKIRVNCSRRGVRIQVKEGYYAWPEQPFTEDRQKDLLQAAFTSPLDAAEIGIRVTLSSTTADSAKLMVRVEPSDVLLAQQGNQYTGELRLMLAAVDAGGNSHGSSMAAMPLRFNAQQHDDVLKKGIGFEENLRLPPGAQKVRLAMLDCTSGAVGSITIPLEAKK
jgi:VWFA-related protein